MDEQEYKIWKTAKEQGKDDAFIKGVISQYRQTKALSSPVVSKPSTSDRIVGGITSRFPGKKVGEAIGTLGGFGLTALKEKLGFAPKGSTSSYDISAPSPLEVGGDIAKGVATVAGLKAPLPVSSTILGTAGKNALQTGVLSTIAGAGESAASGQKNPLEIAKSAFLSGLTGAAIGGVIGAGSKIVSNIIDKAPESLYNNALKVTQKIKTAGKSPSEFLVDEGTWGNLGTFKKTAEEGIDETNKLISDKIDATLAKGLVESGKYTAPQLAKDSFVYNTTAQLRTHGKNEIADGLTKIDFSDVSSFNDLKRKVTDTLGKEVLKDQDVSNWLTTTKQLFNSFVHSPGSEISSKEIINEAISSLKKNLGTQYTTEQLKSTINSLPLSDLLENDTLTVKEANLLRQQIDRTLGDRFFLAGGATPVTKEALGSIANILRKNVQAISGTEKEFSRLSNFIRTNKVVNRAIDLADSKYGLGLYDVLSGAGGAAIGGLTGGEGDVGERLKNAAIGGIVGVGLERGINSPALKTGLAQVLTKIGQLPLDSAGKISREAVIQLISKLTNGSLSGQ